MQFSVVLRLVSDYLGPRRVRWAVVGGLALTARGAGRLTHDVDIVTEYGVQEEMVAHLRSNGYETLHRSEGYSNHLHPDPAFGRLDIVYVRGRTAEELFAAAERLEIVPGCDALVPRPEHLVAMKLLAARNDPTRRLQDLADIVALLRSTGVPAEAVKPYFERHGLEQDWEQVRASV